MSAESRDVVVRIGHALDRIVALFSWLWLLLIAVIVFAVVLRFAFGIGRIELEELQWHLYAVGFLVGIVGCASRDRHVRVDVIRERISPRNRNWVDFYGVLFLQIPLIVLVLWSALPFVAESFATSEKSASAGGLPYRWILKAVLPISFALLGAASFARLVQVGRRLFSGADDAAPAETEPPEARGE